MALGKNEMMRRLLFASSYLPKSLPQYWETVARFNNLFSKKQVTVTSARILVEDTQVIEPNAVITDLQLIHEIIQMEYGETNEQLGIPLVSEQETCLVCKGQLLTRGDRASHLTLYTDNMETVPATHFHKYCANYRKGCKFVQYYGYNKQGDEPTHYDARWMELSYFISSQETGFERSLLKKMDYELLIGQLSYKQKAEIYNVSQGYDTAKKQCSTIQTDTKKTRKTPAHGYVI